MKKEAGPSRTSNPRKLIAPHTRINGKTPQTYLATRPETFSEYLQRIAAKEIK